MLCISSLTPIKGIDILLRAFADINDGCSNLMILGKGELELQLKTLAKDLHIENRVLHRFTQPRRNTFMVERLQCPLLIQSLRGFSYGYRRGICMRKARSGNKGWWHSRSCSK